MDADLPTLDWLAGVLIAHAEAIGKARIAAVVAMPGSPVQDLTTQVSAGVATAFGLLGGNLRDMAEATRTTRNFCAELDAAFEAQLRRYTAGERSR
ncbi:hypothetical protein [Nocardia sp. GAS34]|uniref:hypothetical protein n=1 Tax=unclassified Nocardia TaxID=2637762 RepID=UPI003D2602D8